MALLLLLLCIPMALADPADFIIERVARTGDPVPGIEGAIWTEPAGSLIDAQGNVLFQGNYSIGETPYYAYFYGTPENLTPFMDWTSPAPGFDDPEMLLAWPGNPNLAENGSVATYYHVGDPADYHNGLFCIYTGYPGPLAPTLIDEGPAPDSPEGTTLDFYPSGYTFEPYINAYGQIALWGSLRDYGSSGFDVDAIVAGPPDDLRIVAYGSGPAPDIPGGATFMLGEVPSVGGLALNDLGWVAFSAWFEGPLVDETNGLGLFAGTADDLRLVARIGDQAPGMEEGVHFTNFLWEQVVLDANGNVSFIGFVDGPGVDDTNDGAVWFGPRDNIELVAALREGLHAPGTPEGTSFSFFLGAVPNNRSELLTLGYVDGDDVDEANDQGCWYGPRQDTQLILRDGQQAPELPEGIFISFDTGDYSSSLYSPVLVTNDRGDMVMVCPLLGAVGDTNDRALYFRAADDGVWRLVARTGDQLDGLTIPPEGLRSYTLEPGNGANGLERSFNDDGSFGAFIRYDEGIDSIYRIRRDTLSSIGDSDADGDVDLIDYAVFQCCFGSTATGCTLDFDFDADGLITLQDYESLLSVRTRPSAEYDR